MSRNQRILAWLIANPLGGRFREILEAVEPDCHRTIFAAQVQQLCRTKKITATGAPRHQVYTAGPNAAIDGRRVANAAKKGTRRVARPAPRTSDQVAEVRRVGELQAIAATAKPRMRMDTVNRARLPPASGRGAPGETVEAFLARGGAIQHLAIGAVSQPLTYIGHRAANEVSWRARAGE